MPLSALALHARSAAYLVLLPAEREVNRASTSGIQRLGEASGVRHGERRGRVPEPTRRIQDTDRLMEANAECGRGPAVAAR